MGVLTACRSLPRQLLCSSSPNSFSEKEYPILCSLGFHLISLYSWLLFNLAYIHIPVSIVPMSIGVFMPSHLPCENQTFVGNPGSISVISLKSPSLRVPLHHIPASRSPTGPIGPSIRRSNKVDSIYYQQAPFLETRFSPWGHKEVRPFQE